MIFFDTETCGLHGPIVLIQWARDDGPINLYCPWTKPIKKTLELIEMFCKESDGVVGFNLAFDWFHICQMYNTLRGFKDELTIPSVYIDEYAKHEYDGRDGLCLKPIKALDLMLHARKGPYQSLMDRHDIRIKKVPTLLAWELANVLTDKIPLKDVYFARKKDATKRWNVMDVTDEDGDIVPDVKDIVLKFAPSSALKALAQDALELTESVTTFDEIEAPGRPEEFGYAPYAYAVGKPGNWNLAWPMFIEQHIAHWSYNNAAREYALKDVEYTRGLYKYFGEPDTDDDDSVLACMVGAVRWKGFKINVPAIQNLKNIALSLVDNVEYNFNSPAVCRIYISQVMDDVEKLAMTVNGKVTTKAIVLETIAKWYKSSICPDCKGMGCVKCDEEGLIKTDEKHPAAIRAQEILDFRHAQKEIELYDKLLLAGRFHASFIVIGTKSSRMSGTDGLNAQGIKRAKIVRSCFPLADNDLILCGGDFAGFEVCLADAAYNDPILRADLLTTRPCPDCNSKGCKECNGTGEVGTKIHGLFGVQLFPTMTYDEILATKGLPDAKDKYTRSKNGVFAMLYGGEAPTLVNRVGVELAVAEKAYAGWCKKYVVWGKERKKIFDMFCSMRQPKGIGTKVEWHEPADYIESMFGFKRYFTLENQICKVLFDLAESPPKHWKDLKIKVIRRDREQSACGALRTALFAAAFAVQAANMRAAANHVIQSSGGQLTKELERELWDLQPSGINEWLIQPMNIHDEIMSPTKERMIPKINKTVADFIQRRKEQVPLLEIDWTNRINTWADK